MATIRSQLVLTDGMSGPLRSIHKAMNMALNSFEAMQSATSRPINTQGLQDARDELARLGTQLDTLEQQTQETGNAFGNLARAIGLAVIAKKGFDFLKMGIDYASDLAEVQNVVDVTFGNSADAINSWAKDCLAAYGMNEVSAKRYAGTMGAMLKSSGLSGSESLGMSKDMVGLAGDMASFYNLDINTAFEKIRSGISGETEPLKQLGINMSVANLEAYALSQGIKKSYSEMSQAEQVMLRYNYLMNTTKDAQGDFARTSDSWANQTRLLAEGWREFSGVLAEDLLPILTQIVSWLNSAIAYLTANADTVSAALLGIATGLGILTAATLIQTAATKGLFAALLSNPLFWIAAAIGLVVGLLYRWIQAVGGVSNAWELCKLILKATWLGIQLMFFTGVYKVMDLIDRLKLGWKSMGVAIADYAGDMKVSVLTTLQNMVNGAIDIINKFTSTVNSIFGSNIAVIEHVTFATTAAAENEAAKQSRHADLSAYQQDLENAKAARDAHLDDLRAQLAENEATFQATLAKGKEEAAAKNAASQAALDSIGADTASVAESAGSAAASLKENTEDLKYMRDLAEQEVINRFTTAEVKIDYSGMTNRIDSDMDLDGVLTTLTDGFAEAIEVAAEGVHV